MLFRSFIATKDIAVVAAEYLANPAFTGKTVRALLGPRDYTMAEVTKALGTAIGKPDLPYVGFSFSDAIGGMMGAGISQSVANSYIGLMEGINEGVFGLEERNKETTTPTTIEEFASQFAMVYNM